MWKYANDGRFLVGIPARDLTIKEFEALAKVDQEAVKHCGFYEFVKADKPAKESK